MQKTAIWTVVALVAASPLHAQTIDPHHVIGAAIASDIARDRQAERDARRTPYASPGYGAIATAAAARDACAAKALYQAGPDGKLIGRPRASTMATGWEVEGEIGFAEGGAAPFVCSVRNGSVSGVLLQR
ncbi:MULTISPECIES: hypothetical protein [Sphingobium]|uniref:Excinuclease ABC subunit A n=1 Tax=Sphingobium cupriresistens TaxID=1132417 RepID=A0A8G1ZI68_9SPHN|nr:MULTISPECIES: hypothetical protein [Sphingobium]MBJ7378234.1 hypothetical protein [Sphingobium sp.]RYM13573.1 hypothetical protein EWH12_04930 [Sphingobium cupriresistens]